VVKVYGGKEGLRLTTHDEVRGIGFVGCYAGGPFSDHEWGAGEVFSFHICFAWFWFLLLFTLWQKKGFDGIMSEGRWWCKDSNTPLKITLR